MTFRRLCEVAELMQCRSSLAESLNSYAAVASPHVVESELAPLLLEKFLNNQKEHLVRNHAWRALPVVLCRVTQSALKRALWSELKQALAAYKSLDADTKRAMILQLPAVLECMGEIRCDEQEVWAAVGPPFRQLCADPDVRNPYSCIGFIIF